MAKEIIQQDSPKPIRTQLKEILLRHIATGSFVAGGRIPAERELAEDYGISRASVRETITELINSGLLFRTVGKGTFVSETVQSLPDTTAYNIAFIISEEIFNFVQTGYNRILAGVQHVCRDRNSRLLFNSVGDEFGGLTLPDEQNGKNRWSGAIVVGGVRGHVVDRLHEEGIPIVLVDLLINDERHSLPSVTIDYETGAREAIQHLHSAGHRRIGYIGFSSSQKYNGYWTALEELNLLYDPRAVEFLQLLDLQPGILAGYQAMQRMINRKRLPTAILVTNDFVATGVLEALGMAGIRVPDQISIVGFDDLGLKTSPALTTVRVDLRRVGEEAAEILFGRIEGRNDSSANSVVQVELIVRGTTSTMLEARLRNQDSLIPISSPL